MARSYNVKKGDTLKKIAKVLLGDAALYARLADFNGIRDPNAIFVGQRIEIPSQKDLAPPALPETTVSGELQPPHGLDEILATFGDIYTYLREDGTLDPRWETEQLTRAALPFSLPLSWDSTKQVGSLYCHRKAGAVFQAVFREIDARGLRPRLRTYGGCFNFRAKRSSNKLSVHSWGVAVDLNPETNGMGSPGDMDSGVVEVFEAFGFSWGGRWAGKSKDPMHFQYCSGY